MKYRIALLTLLLITLTGLTSAQIVFDDSSNVEFNTGLDLTGQSIVGYYNGACPNGEAVTDIQDDGTLVCESVSGGTTQGLPSVLSENSTADQNINLDGNTLTGLPAPSNADEPVNLDYLENNFEASANQNLSQVLENGNVANQSIEFDSSTGVAIGDSSTSSSLPEDISIGRGASADGYSNTDLYSTAVGYSSSADGNGASAFGSLADVSGSYAVGIGQKSNVIGNGAVVIGQSGDASANYAVVLGSSGDASREGAVAIGRSANAPNSYEATFGNLDDDQLDLNVTGNTTIHGEGGLTVENGGINVNYGEIYNVGDIQSDFATSQLRTAGTGSAEWVVHDMSTSDDIIRFQEGGNVSIPNGNLTVNGDLNVGGELTGVSTGGSSQNLSQVLAKGNIANQTIEFDSNSAIAFGNENTLTDGSDQIVVGKEASAEGSNGIAIGKYAWTQANHGTVLGYSAESTNSYAIALGRDAEASGAQAIAMGYNSRAPNDNEATFGNLQGEELDLNITGDATVHGSGGLMVKNGGGVELRDSSAGQPVLEYRMQEGDDYGAYVKYDSSYEGSTSDNRLVIGTEDSGNEYDVLTAERSGGLATVHRNTDFNSNYVQDVSQIRFSSGNVEIGDSSTYTKQTQDLAIGAGANASADAGYDSATAIGHGASATETGTLALGEGSNAGYGHATALGPDTNATENSIAVGHGAEADGPQNAISIGTESASLGSDSVSLGYLANNTGDGAISIGREADATANGAVAIGYQANAPNANEVTLGNLNGGELDLNVTGDTTIHGSGGLDMPNGIILGGSAEATDDVSVAVGKNSYANGIASAASTAVGLDANASQSGNSAFGDEAEATGQLASAFGGGSMATGQRTTAIGIFSNATSQYATTLGMYSWAKDTAGTALGYNSQAFDMFGTGVGVEAKAKGYSSTVVGAQSNATGDRSAVFGSIADAGTRSVSLGSEANASTPRSVALGQLADVIGPGAGGIAIGRDAMAQGSGIAIGEEAFSDENRTAVFGGGIYDYDVNVTGDLQVDGQLTGVSTGGAPEGLSETLTAGNVANQSIEFENSILIGSEGSGLGAPSTTGGSNQVAIGPGSSISDDGQNSMALGPNSEVQGKYGAAVGPGARATGGGSAAGSALGSYAEASANFASALGSYSSASAEGAVGIGANSVSNQQYTARFGSDGQAYDVDVTGDLSVDGRVNEQNVRDISYSSGHTAWSSGLSTEEVNRFGTTSTESVEVDRLDVQVKGGGTNSDFEVEAYDAGTGSVLGSTTAGTPINDVGTTSEGGDLTIRVTNSAGSDVTASITVTGHVVE